MTDSIPSSTQAIQSTSKPSSHGYDIEVVCRDRSCESEGTEQIHDATPRPTMSLPLPRSPSSPKRSFSSRSSGRRAKIHPFPIAEDTFTTSHLKRMDGDNRYGHCSAGTVHIKARGGGELAPKSPFDQDLSTSGNNDVSITSLDGTAAMKIATTTSSVFDQLDRKRKPKSLWKQRVADFMDGVTFAIISILFTILILYTDLIRAAVAPPSADPYFLGLTIFYICAFFLEILISSLVRTGYFLKFYFWMDLVASFSLLCDIPGFMDGLTGNNDDSNRHITLDRAAKAAQAGARSARIMQVIAVYQLLKYKARRMAQSGGKGTLSEDGSMSVDSDSMVDGAPPAHCSSLKKPRSPKNQTRVGEKVTEMTMRKVILGVLLLLLMLPIFDIYVYYGQPTFLEDGGLVMLHTLYIEEGNSTGFQHALNSYIDENIYRVGTRETGYLYRLTVHNITYVNEDPELRKDEKQTSTVRTPQCSNATWAECYESKAWVNVKWQVQMQAFLDIGRVTFILSVLSIGAVLFIRDTDKLVLQPIERMVGQVKSISQNPLAVQSMKLIKKKKGGSGNDEKQLETRILEHSISKICSLLSVGFGEAGAEVIADNIKSGGDLNPMIPGRKVVAIFGFCDIRQFTDATEILQEEIMEFVNSIASIVHTEVALHGGAANKNIGDAFLLVWKLPGSAGGITKQVAGPRSSIIGAKASQSSHAGGPQDNEIITHLADAALASFIIIQAALKRSKKLKEYGTRDDLNARIPNFSVRMGFGLHVGWAIEGAIGSHHKIDASYLSPHVNMAARLEAATKQFGVPMLLSEAFVQLLSPSVKMLVRQIDCVTVKGSTQPIGLYTMDINLDAIPLALESGTSPQGVPAKNVVPGTTSIASGGNSKSDQQHLTYSDFPYFNEFEEHPDIVATKMENAEFLARFAEGFAAYRAGEWRRAAAIFEETKTMRRAGDGVTIVVDGPSEALLSILREKGCVAPNGWKGYRELTEK